MRPVLAVHGQLDPSMVAEVAEWREDGKADIVPGLLFIDEARGGLQRAAGSAPAKSA